MPQQAYLALAIKRVRSYPVVNKVEHTISTEMVRMRTTSSATNAELVGFVLSGHQIFHEGAALAARWVLLLRSTPISTKQFP